MVYDRKQWEEESGKKGDRFNLGAVVGERGSDYEMLVKRAETLYISIFGYGKGVCLTFVLPIA